MKYLLDTNIISELISTSPNQKAINFVRGLNEEDLYLSVITIGEIQAGIEKLVKSKKKKQLSQWLENDLLHRFKNRIVTIDIEIMLQWGVINSKLRSIGKPLPILDSIIGATAQSKDFILLTRNKKDFQKLDIEIINPFN